MKTATLILAALAALPATTAAQQNPAFTASGVTETRATLTLTNHTGSPWYYKRTAPSADTCESVTNGFVAQLSGLEPGQAYTYDAYSGATCAADDLLAGETFTTLNFHLTGKTRNSATLSLDNYAAGQEWWIKQTYPSGGSCTSAGTGTSTQVTGLTKNTSYTYKAFGASSCASSDELGIVAFKTLPPHVLSVGGIKQTEATLTLANANIAWKHKQTDGPGTGTCTDVAAGTDDAKVTGLTANTDYTFTAYREHGCTEQYVIDWVSFTTLPNPPTVQPTLSATARIEGAELSWTPDNTTGVDGWEYQVETGGTWGSWKAMPGSSASTTSYTVPNLTGGSSYKFKVRAFNRGGGGPASDASASVTVLVKPSVSLSLSTTTLAENAAETTVTVTAQFSNTNTFVSDKTVTVTVGGSGTATSGTDYDAVSDFDITISKNTSSGTGTFDLDPTDDAVFEGSETITVAGTSTGLTVTSASLTLTDNDDATVTVNDSTANEGDDITFTVTLDNAVQGGLTVTPDFTDVSAVEGTDYDENTSALSFTGTAGETKTFTVSTTEDAILEGDETFTVGLSVSDAPSGGGGGGRPLTPARARSTTTTRPRSPSTTQRPTKATTSPSR